MVAPHLIAVSLDGPLPDRVVAMLDRSVELDPAGMDIEEIKLGSPDGRVLYETVPSQIGVTYELTQELRMAAQGQTVIMFEDWLRHVPRSPASDNPPVEEPRTLLEI